MAYTNSPPFAFLDDPFIEWHEAHADAKVPVGGGPIRAHAIPGGAGDPHRYDASGFVLAPTVNVEAYGESSFNGPQGLTQAVIDWYANLVAASGEGNAYGGWRWTEGLMWVAEWRFFSNDTPVIVARGITPAGALDGPHRLFDPLVHSLVFTPFMPTDWQYQVVAPPHVNRMTVDVYWGTAPWAPFASPAFPNDFLRPVDADYPYKDPSTSASPGDSGVVRRGAP